MWPFTPKTLYDRYSKLMKLIMSIDSHFEVTENKEDSVRLHLPNYKGNQPMDFHIYLMEPFLFISFVTEVEGEKISVLNNYHQNTDQQDMFNMAMASNLDRMHEVLNKKYDVNEDHIGRMTINDNEQRNVIKAQKELNESQRYALFYFAVLLGCDLYSRWHIDKASELVRDYQSELELSNDQAMSVASPNSNLKWDDHLDTLKTIDDESVIDSFLYTCVSLVDENQNEDSKRIFYDMTKGLGYTEETIKEKIKNLGFKNETHFFDKEKMDYAQQLNKTIVKSWSLMEFARNHGKMQVGDFVNKDTGEKFKACIFTKPDGTRTFVAFASAMGELTPQQIAAMKDELRVVQLESGNYSLCKVKKDPWGDVIIKTSNHDIQQDEEHKSNNQQSAHDEEMKDVKINNDDKNDVTDSWADEDGIPYIIDFMPSSPKNRDEKICDSLSSELNDNTSMDSNDDDLIDIFIDEYGVKYSLDKKVLKKVPNDKKEYSIIEGTEIIGDAAFSNCDNLVSVTMPDSVIEIGHYAFAGCKKIFSFIIPRGVKSIGDGAFMRCETLKSLRLSEGLASISDDAFDGCNNLNTIFVPAEEKVRFEIMLSKFDVNIAEYNSNNVSALDELLSGLLDEYGVLYSKDGKTMFTHTKKLSSYAIKPGTEIISARAFSPIDGVDDDNVTLKQIILPETITTIWDSAFANNEGLKEISLPTSINTIGKDVFVGCKSLCTIHIPHGTRAKFERLLPEWKNILVEKIGIVSDTLSDFELPDGSIYNGRCFRNPFGSVVLDGIGSLSYPNGDKYKGNFKNGRPYGWGIYWFKNGKHSHKGFFDDLPKGIGYLNEDYDMAVGNFFEGRLHGWAVCYRNRILKFGYWEKGKLIKDETNKTLWIRKQISHERAYYQGNLIQIDNKHEYIRFGVPPKIIGEKIPGIPESQLPKMPAWGFEFFKDGSVKVGAIRNHDSGEFTMYYPDGRSELGKWQEGVKTSSFTIDWLQKPVDEYEVDGLDVF